MPNFSLDISVVIPTYNRAEILRRALRAYAEQTLPARCFEVIVADDGSRDETASVVEQAQRELALSIVYSHAANAGANVARNRAIRIARGRICVIVNDDTIAGPGFLAAHLAQHRKYESESTAILGKMTIAPELPWSVFADLHLDASFRDLVDGAELGWRGFFTCNLSVKTAFLLSHGLFDERMRWHEDIELGRRLHPHGLQVFYCKEALGWHLHFLRENDYLGVAGREGKSLAEWYRKSPEMAEELGMIGFYPNAGLRKRCLYQLADTLINRRTEPLLLNLARRMACEHPRASRVIYQKLYQAKKRAATRQALSGRPSTRGK